MQIEIFGTTSQSWDSKLCPPLSPQNTAEANRNNIIVKHARIITKYVHTLSDLQLLLYIIVIIMIIFVIIIMIIVIV